MDGSSSPFSSATSGGFSAAGTRGGHSSNAAGGGGGAFGATGNNSSSSASAVASSATLGFVKEALGVEDDMGSPTFPIIHEYADKDDNPVYHIDLYRLKDATEAIQAGVQDCLDSGHYCFVEWPVRAPALFGEEVAHCRIKTCGTNTRSLELKL